MILLACEREVGSNETHWSFFVVAIFASKIFFFEENKNTINYISDFKKMLFKCYDLLIFLNIKSGIQ